MAASSAVAGKSPLGQPKQLSSTVLQMKFMKRKHEAEVRKALEEQQQRVIDESHWVLEVDESAVQRVSLIVEEPSYVDCEGLLVCGRRSFGAFNPDIEKLQREEQMAKSHYREMKETISDQEMARRYLGTQSPGASVDDSKPMDSRKLGHGGANKRKAPDDAAGKYQKKAFIKPE